MIYLISIPVKSIVMDPRSGTTKSVLRTEFYDIDEEWRPFIYASTDSGWKISNYGRVKNRKGELVTLHYDKDGYTRFCFYIPKDDEIYLNDKPIHSVVKTHRAVALAFIDNDDPKKDIVMHKNDIPDCNFAINLKWGTSKENMDDKRLSNRSFYHRGEETTMSKFKEKDVHFICNCLEHKMSYGEIIASAGYRDMPESFLKSYRILMINLKRRHIWKYITDQYDY